MLVARPAQKERRCSHTWWQPRCKFAATEISLDAGQNTSRDLAGSRAGKLDLKFAACSPNLPASCLPQRHIRAGLFDLLISYAVVECYINSSGTTCTAYFSPNISKSCVIIKSSRHQPNTAAPLCLKFYLWFEVLYIIIPDCAMHFNTHQFILSCFPGHLILIPPNG